MITEPKSEQEEFQDRLSQSYEEIKLHSLPAVRAKAWDHFLEMGLPDRKAEVFRYLKMRQFYTHRYTSAQESHIDPSLVAEHVLPEARNSYIVFLNGYFAPHLSNTTNLPSKIVISSIGEAFKTYGSYINNQWAKSLKEETDPFAILNAALHPKGAFIYLPPKTYFDDTLQIINVIYGQENTLVMPRIHFFIGGQSTINIASTQAIIDSNHLAINSVFEFAVEEDAHVKFNQTAFEPKHSIWEFCAIRASLKRNSTFKSFSATTGSTSIRHDYKVSLAGENAETQLNGIWMLADQSESHTHILVDHQAPYCRSMQLFKGVLTDLSHSSFEGKIYVRQAAQKTEAFQLNNNLLLSDRAAADSKPNLEIFADDVKASHGATVGQLDENQLFYMQTRGFSINEAQNLLMHGFTKEVIDLFSVESLRTKVNEVSESFLIKE